MKRSFLRRRTRRILRRSPRYLLLSMLWSLAACSGFLQFQSCDGNCSHDYNGMPGSCTQAGIEPGQPGGPCDGITCNGNSRCVNKTCLPCGSNGEVCCTQTLEQPFCNAGVSCVSEGDWSSYSYGTCNSSCGVNIGDPCCPGDGTRCQQGVCETDTDTCVNPPGAAELCQGSESFSGYGLDSAGCVHQNYNFSSDGSADAQQCLADMAAQDGLAPSALDAMEYPIEYCAMSIMSGQAAGTTYVYVTDQSQTTSCEQSLCGSATCTITQGACPGG